MYRFFLFALLLFGPRRQHKKRPPFLRVASLYIHWPTSPIRCVATNGRPKPTDFSSLPCFHLGRDANTRSHPAIFAGWLFAFTPSFHLRASFQPRADLHKLRRITAGHSQAVAGRRFCNEESVFTIVQSFGRVFPRLLQEKLLPTLRCEYSNGFLR